MRHRKRYATRSIVTFQPDKGQAIKMAVYDKRAAPSKYLDNDRRPMQVEHFKRK